MTTPERVNKLKAAMQGMAGTAQAIVPLPPVDSAPEEARRSQPSPSRRGKRVVSACIDPAAAKQLRLLVVEHDSSTQALVEEALNDLFRKYGRSAIA